MVLACLFIPIQVIASDYEGIEVSGQGSLVVVPDQFSLTLTITERGRVPDKLKALVDKKSQSVVNVASSLGVKNSNISTARVNLRVVEEKPSIQVQGVELHMAKQGSTFVDGQSVTDSNPNNQKPILFELNRQIMVNFSDIEQYDKFLGNVIKLKVSNVSPLVMNVVDRETYYQQALLQAISHAKEKATKMAKQAGLKLGEIQFIKEQSRNHFRPVYAESMMRNQGASTHNSLVGSQTITASILVNFELID